VVVVEGGAGSDVGSARPLGAEVELEVTGETLEHG
jgi:hypothetical protein